ncbi:glycoside hydrolase family 5 protein [Rhizobium panacihumi]|uniref:glycoside hydrolase family 5 protein n=1 Tax=Rhizobium panacihumi TaxID=2008450 RepID=UPI003D7B4C10
MKRLVAACALFALFTSIASAAPLELKRGVGLHQWLNWAPLAEDGSYRRPPYRSVEQWLTGDGRKMADWPKGGPFEQIRTLGFDFVRLSVDPGPLVERPERREETLALLSKNVQRLTDAGLNVVFDLHGVGQVPAYSMKMIYDGADSEGVTRYRDMVKAVAAMLAEIGAGKVALEPYNEPAYYPCDASGTDDWQRIMTQTVEDIRSVSKTLTIVTTGACGGGVRGLGNLDPVFDDENILYSFHMYDPLSFTHQRSEEKGGFHSGFPWPARSGSPDGVVESLRAHMSAAGLSLSQQDEQIGKLQKPIKDYFKSGWDETMLKARIGEAVTWARKHDIPSARLFMGEFGAIRMTDDGRAGAYDADRLYYLKTVRETAESHGIAWSIWEYANPYGMTVIQPTDKAVPDDDLLRAIGLKPSSGL